MPNLALTDAGIRRLALPDTGTQTYWDTTEKGLGVRVSPKGTRTFIVLMGSGSRHKLGRFPHLPLGKAREEARKLLAQKTLGEYQKPSSLRFEDALERYLKACAEKTARIRGWSFGSGSLRVPNRCQPPGSGLLLSAKSLKGW